MSNDDKQSLRRQAITRRDAIEDQVRHAAAARIAARAEDILAVCQRDRQGQQPIVSSYLAIGSELDPTSLCDRLRVLGAIVALPVMVAKADPLEFRAWQAGEPLVRREWGIREPGPTCPAVVPDILLVPLLLVDGCGNRLGYGGGYYDRTLAALRRQREVAATGVAYEEQRVDAVSHRAYDEPLDYLLTPERFEALG